MLNIRTMFLRQAHQHLVNRLRRLYGEDQIDAALRRLNMMFGRYCVGEMVPEHQEAPWSERDAFLITYGDMVQRDDEAPLRTLRRFCEDRLDGVVNTVHILPFYPYSSDDGFSVIDYRAVDPALGRWRDVKEFSGSFRMMFDLVLNHCSAESSWFKDFCLGIAPQRDYFVTADPEESSLDQVVRPRSLPLLTPFHTRQGEKHVWTTFSADQVDLDFRNLDVLFEFLDILMWYVAQGASVIRLDAVAFLWKKIGTNCIHLPETHEVVKLLRDFLDIVAPGTILISETNVPHHENISYFGAGDEAHMVYQFSLPPLLLHALLKQDATWLTEWAASLAPPPAGCTFFNFTASHDGVGVRPMEGLVPPEEVHWLAEQVRRNGGRVSTRRMPDGSDAPYELNITYFDALADEQQTEVGAEHIDRFLCSQTLPMALQGVPAFYFHSLVACRNNVQGVERTGHNRTINRYKWPEAQLLALLDDETFHARVFDRIRERLRRRAEVAAFHPSAAQSILALDKRVFAVKRSPAEGMPLIALHNLSGDEVTIHLGQFDLCDMGHDVQDLLSDEKESLDCDESILLAPYQVRWIQPIP